MSLSDQLNALQKQAEDLKSFADQARHETNEEIKARVAKARADITARQDAVKAKVGQAGEQAQSQWQAMKAEAAARAQDVRDRMDRVRGGDWFSPSTSGNRAFDDYREDTLKRLEEEQREFKDFLARLRFARDRAEFDQFMTERRNRPFEPGSQSEPAPPRD